MLADLLDVFRLRQYFNVISGSRDVVRGLREDAAFLAQAADAAFHLPSGEPDTSHEPVFPHRDPFHSPLPPSEGIAIATTGGSGAMASVVGAARAVEEAGLHISAFSLCSGAALYGFPLAAGVDAEHVAQFVLGLRPRDYIDVDWSRLLLLLPTLGRGFAGVIKGDAIEEAYGRLLGDMTLGELPIPAYAPIWNVEHNSIEYLGPATHPDVPVARAIRMAVSLPLFIHPVEYGGLHWQDGGIVDIFPVHPLLDIEKPCAFTLAINGFYPPDFRGEDASGWQDRRVSILDLASQVGTCQQIQLARENLARLRHATHVAMIEPVPYREVRGVGFYRQFFSARDWPDFMRAGRLAARQALRSVEYA
ncbi:MAG: patatin-like phospholipase family protein [Mycobacterium sp.]|nr:patatin-like phospholipase family protein [Mycobacterium sp.]